MSTALPERLAARTLELVEIPSVGRDDAEILRRVRSMMPADFFDLADDIDGVLLYLPRSRRNRAPLVVLCGHVDTVPAGGSAATGADATGVVGRGSADMKGALAVMLEVAGDLASGSIASDTDLGLLFFGREELPITQSTLLPLLDRRPDMSRIDLALVMEPTDNAIQIGCLGNLTAAITIRGSAAHSARPWLGSNAIHTAIRALAPIADLPVRDVEVGGLVFREAVSVTTIEGGVAANVVPDLVRAQVNLRYAPNHTSQEAEARLRELLPGAEVQIEVLGNAPPGPIVVSNRLVQRLRESGDLKIGPKQAWTPVAELATAGIDAVNFGPGDPRYAHHADERIETAALVRSYEIVRAFLCGERAGKGSV